VQGPSASLAGKSRLESVRDQASGSFAGFLLKGSQLLRATKRELPLKRTIDQTQLG